MTSWFDGRLCAIDCETTGVDPEQDRIVQAATWCVGGGEEPVGSSTLVDPGVPIPESATAIHGITTERVRAVGVPAPVATLMLSKIVTSAIDERLPIVVFNARFDLTLLDRECGRHGIEPPPWDRVRVIDPLVIDKHLDRYRKGSRKLDAICATYGARLDQAHAAADDALAAARAAWVLGAKGEVVRRIRYYGGHTGRDTAEKKALEAEWAYARRDLDRLHIAQRRWALAERERFAEYKASQGEHEEAARIAAEVGWPVLERRAVPV